MPVETTPDVTIVTQGDRSAPAPAQYVVEFAVDTLEVDALGVPVPIPVQTLDRSGTPVSAPVYLSVTDPTVAGFAEDGKVTAIDNGTAWMRGSGGGGRDSMLIVVEQRPARIETAEQVMFGTLRTPRRLTARIVDRGGSTVNMAPQWRSLEPEVVQVEEDGVAEARAVGTALAEVIAGDVVDTVSLVVRQVPATIALTTPDTVVLDGEIAAVAVAYDSGGSVIADGVVEWATVGTFAIRRDGGRLMADLPGAGVLVARMGQVADSARLVVEGAAITVDGVRVRGQAEVQGLVLMHNGRLQMRVGASAEQIGGVVVDVWNETLSRWEQGNTRHYGDWLYVGTSVHTPPTRTVVDASRSDEVRVRTRFDNHVFDPFVAGFRVPGQYVQPYPFERLTVLRSRDDGYFTFIDLLAPLQPNLNFVEHEIGFGGVWGAGLLRSGRESFRTESLSSTQRWNAAAEIDAFELQREGDPIRRVLVPLFGTPVISPVFNPDIAFGGVYVHSLIPSDYGAYQYLAPVGRARSGRAVCREAWSAAPFAVPSVSEAALSSCGFD